MVILVCVLCFVNGAVLGALLAAVLCRRKETAAAQQAQAKATRMEVQWGNLLGYAGSDAGQKQVETVNEP